jgi:hypothetical protein
MKIQKLRADELLKRISVSSMAELEERLLAGVASLDRGAGIDGKEAFQRLRKRIRNRNNRG